MTTKIDHIIIGAHSLESGEQFVKETLGVDIPRGGEHPHMATHNSLMQLGNETFFEVIAINPNGTPPGRPRWFGLDDPAVRDSLATPRLLCWAANTTDLHALQKNTTFDLGEITPLSRGQLNWLFTVPDDGRLLAAGMLPYVLQWQTETHPSNNMTDKGCTLESINVYHPNVDWYSTIIRQMGASELVTVNEVEPTAVPYLTAELKTPLGKVVLDSRG